MIINIKIMYYHDHDHHEHCDDHHGIPDRARTHWLKRRWSQYKDQGFGWRTEEQKPVNNHNHTNFEGEDEDIICHHLPWPRLWIKEERPKTYKLSYVYVIIIVIMMMIIHHHPIQYDHRPESWFMTFSLNEGGRKRHLIVINLILIMSPWSSTWSSIWLWSYHHGHQYGFDHIIMVIYNYANYANLYDHHGYHGHLGHQQLWCRQPVLQLSLVVLLQRCSLQSRRRLPMQQLSWWWLCSWL